MKNRSSVSIIILVKKQYRISWLFVLPMPCLNPSGTVNYIDHVQITAAETVGVEDRGGYYEQAGALRDMVQNHILQLLCMIAMEAPTSFEANEIRNKKVDVLNAIRKINTEDVHDNAVRGQYAARLDERK